MAATPIPWTLNGRPASYQGDGAQPLLWHLRDELGLRAAKYGCGIGACGACTVQVDGQAMPSCMLPMQGLAGRRVTTLEGLSAGESLHAVQRAWMEQNVPQCGYCQAGQMTAAASLRHPRPTEEQVDAAMRAVLCRCGTYLRVRAAVQRAAEFLAGAAS
jgi:isoquinoline 1-oxidoreductase subunit alpha